MTTHRLPVITVFDVDGAELVGAGYVLHHLPPSRRPWHERIADAPPPVGQFNGHPVWRRRDIEPNTLFPKETPWLTKAAPSATTEPNGSARG